MKLKKSFISDTQEKKKKEKMMMNTLLPILDDNCNVPMRKNKKEQFILITV